MEIVSVFYAAFGYLALLAAIFWGMLFVGDGVSTFRSDFRGETRQRGGFDWLAALPAAAHYGTIDCPASKGSGRGGKLCPKTRRTCWRRPTAPEIRAPTRNYLPRSYQR